MNGRIIFSLTASCLVVLGCADAPADREDASRTPKAPPVGEPEKKSESQPKDEQTSRRIGGMKFNIPGGWEEKPSPSAVLLAEFSLPGKSAPGRLTLSTAGGGTAANIERWKGQFQRGPADPEPKESQITVAGKVASMIELQGTFTDMFGGGGAKSEWQLIGVAIPIDADHNYFIKLTGPRDTIAARRDEFLKFVETAETE